MCMAFLIGKVVSLMPGSGLMLGRAQELHAPGVPRTVHFFFFLTQTRECVGVVGEGTEKQEGGQSR